MPDFSPDYVPSNGSAINPAGLNQNLYRVTSGKAIYEIGNGHIETANFDPVFEIQPHHVRPGEAGDAISVGQILPNDYFSDLRLQADSDDYVAVVGACITFYQRYDVSVAMFSASGFCTYWRQFGPATGAFGTRVAAPNIKVKAFVASGAGTDRTMIGHTERKKPQSVFFNSASVDPDAEIAIREQRVCSHFNILHPRVTGGTSPCGPLAAGWHTFGLAVLVNQNLTGQDTSDVLQDMRLNLNGGGSDGRPTSFYSGIQRLRIYARNVSAIRLL